MYSKLTGMGSPSMSEEVSIRPAGEHVALVEFSRPPHNYFDDALIEAIADAYEQLGRDGSCRAIVLCSEGRNFCAGANFGGPNPAEGDLYEHCVRLFSAELNADRKSTRLNSS